MDWKALELDWLRGQGEGCRVNSGTLNCIVQYKFWRTS